MRILKTDPVESDLQKETLPFGIEDIIHKKSKIFQEKSAKSSIIPIENLPFGIEHIFDSTNE